MTSYRICLVSGWCGNLRLIVAEHLEATFRQAGYQYRMSQQSVWDNPAPPQGYNLVLQLMPAFTEAEVGCPVITVKPLLKDHGHGPTMSRVMAHLAATCPVSGSDSAAGRGAPPQRDPGRRDHIERPR